MKIGSSLLLALSLFAANTATATLGEPLVSVQRDASQLKATQKPAQKSATTGEPFTVAEMQADGNTIKQFSNAHGIVFAVTWTGISKPDLKTLFGKYFTEYSEASEEIPKQVGVKTIKFKTSQLVIRRSGRMRDQRGLAYIPTLVPEGTNAEDLP